MHSTTIVVPCYNEAERLDLQPFRAMIDEGVELLFVDDGSTDSTLDLLRGFESETDGVSVLALSPNRGKGEAVRQGMLTSAQGSPDIIGFIDADMATPLEEVIRLVEHAKTDSADAIIGSRIAYLGTEIDRTVSRHLLGRVFATAASLAIDAKVYDTQCGAKFFRRSDLLMRVIEEPFHSRWAFDVELLGRILAERGTVIEVPLRRWIDVPGSKISFKSMLKAGLDLVQIRAHLAKKQ